MYKHYDLISIYANNKLDAKLKILEFLNCYQKKDITIFGVEGKNNHYEVEVEFFDNYKDDCSNFESSNFILLEDEDIKSLKLKL